MSHLLIFSRNRHAAVEQIDAQTIRSSCYVQDHLTEAHVEITAILPDLEITGITGEVLRSEEKPCSDLNQNLRKVIGIRIGPGMIEIIQGLLGNSVPKSIAFMVEECCHGVILSFTKDTLKEAPQDENGRLRYFSKMVKKNIRLYNRCAAFAPGSRLVEGIQPPH